ncbi:hypothetical protein ABZ917_08570 [Nonomuraea wenchangensis]
MSVQTASELLHGAAAAAAPVAVEMGQPSGYVLAAYLLQHAEAERRTASVPAAVWEAVLCACMTPRAGPASPTA